MLSWPILTLPDSLFPFFLPLFICLVCILVNRSQKTTVVFVSLLHLVFLDSSQAVRLSGEHPYLLNHLTVPLLLTLLNLCKIHNYYHFPMKRRLTWESRQSVFNCSAVPQQCGIDELNLLSLYPVLRKWGPGSFRTHCESQKLHRLSSSTIVEWHYVLFFSPFIMSLFQAHRRRLHLRAFTKSQSPRGYFPQSQQSKSPS